MHNKSNAVIQLSIGGEFIAEFESVRKAARAMGVHHSGIKRAADPSKTKSECAGYRWVFKDDYELHYDKAKEFGRKFHWSYDDENGTAVFLGVADGQIKSKDDALEFCKVDLDIWDLKRHEFKYWTTTMKVRTTITDRGKVIKPGVKWIGQKVAIVETPTIATNTGITMHFVLKENNQIRKVKELLTMVPRIEPFEIIRMEGKKNLAVEPCIFDLHLGKYGFDAQHQTLTWSLEETREQYFRVVNDFLTKVDLHRVKQFILPFGNDMLHVDDPWGSTTRGTHVGDSGMWFEIYKYGSAMIRETAQQLAQYAPVYMYPVPGNHDYRSVLLMGDKMEAIFENHPDVYVQSYGDNRLYHKFGVSIIIYHHGDKTKPERIKDALIADRPDLIQGMNYIYAHLGHEHRSIKKEYFVRETVREEFGIEIEYIPSISPTDYWHHTNIFIGNQRKAKTFIYDEDLGQVGQIICPVLNNGRRRKRR